ncbi:DMT family transporter [Sediminicoccus sp. KRV36]|uniref:DMT family transporter n=1 Tax=Sediminicoccus sp. KRV36 TaxID=3133721 RepID=UPI00200FEB9F|nr:DMT family transporter [Sediminicoccus rosea]
MWGSAFNAARIVALEWPPLWALAIRFAGVVPLLWLIWRWRRVPFAQGSDRWRLAVMGGFGMGGYLACAWVASAHVPSGLVALLAACSPLFVALGEAWRGQRLAPLGWLGLGLGWIGVATLGLLRSADGLEAAEAWGIGLTLCGAFLQAVGVLAYAPARARMDPWSANLGQTVVASVVLIALAGLIGGPLPRTASPMLIGGMLYASLVVGVAGYALFFLVIRRFGASNAAALQLMAPPVAALLGWSFMEERLAWGDLLGGAITLAGLLLMFRAR